MRSAPRPAAATPPRRLSRRRLLLSGAAGSLGAAFAGVELVAHGVLPGRQELEELTGGCPAHGPEVSFGVAGPTRSGTFHSAARGRQVGFTIAYPPGHGPGSVLPLAIYLHGYGGSHRDGLGHVSLAQALAGRTGGIGLPPMALAAVDGGGLYWNPHPGDDPQAMLIREFIPLCRRLGLGRRRVGVIGISMGGYGAVLLAETRPSLISAVAAISPAVWTTYAQARSANAGAFASGSAFSTDDVITHAARLQDVPVRVASGTGDPFHPGVVALARALPRSATVQFAEGCHDAMFFSSQQHQSLAFLGRHLTD